MGEAIHIQLSYIKANVGLPCGSVKWWHHSGLITDVLSLKQSGGHHPNGLMTMAVMLSLCQGVLDDNHILLLLSITLIM